MKKCRACWCGIFLAGASRMGFRLRLPWAAISFPMLSAAVHWALDKTGLPVK